MGEKQAVAKTTAGISTASTFCTRPNRFTRSLLWSIGFSHPRRPPIRPPTRPPIQMQGTIRLACVALRSTPGRGNSARETGRNAAWLAKPVTLSAARVSIARRYWRA
eukprot:scaffold54891_cov69-Phaeocystis_antarctica.AAC.1